MKANHHPRPPTTDAPAPERDPHAEAVIRRHPSPACPCESCSRLADAINDYR